MSLHAFTTSASFVFAQGEIAMQRGVTKVIINGVFTRGEIATRRGVTKSTVIKIICCLLETNCLLFLMNALHFPAVSS